LTDATYRLAKAGIKNNSLMSLQFIVASHRFVWWTW